MIFPWGSVVEEVKYNFLNSCRNLVQMYKCSLDLFGNVRLSFLSLNQFSINCFMVLLRWFNERGKKKLKFLAHELAFNNYECWIHNWIQLYSLSSHPYFLSSYLGLLDIHLWLLVYLSLWLFITSYLQTWHMLLQSGLVCASHVSCLKK